MAKDFKCKQDIENITRIHLKFEATFEFLHSVLLEKGVDSVLCVQVCEELQYNSVSIGEYIWLTSQELCDINKKRRKTKYITNYIPIATLDCFDNTGIDFKSPAKLLFVFKGYTAKQLSDIDYQKRIEECNDIVLTFETVLYLDSSNNLIKQENVK